MSHVRLAAAQRAAIAVLVVLAAACGGRRESSRPGESAAETRGERRIEPPLTGQTVWMPCRSVLRRDHVLEEVECGPENIPQPPVSLANEACDSMTTDHREAIRTLVSRRHCTDAVIERLETIAKERRDGRVLSDLAAAYYVRAQRRDNPSDLLRALDAAERAVAAAPGLREAKFNRALAQESLGLDDDATASWDELRTIDRSPWGTEAAEHRRKLVRRSSIAAATQWSLNQQRLADGVTITDPVAVSQLIAPFPAAAQRYVEEDVLPAWAEAAEARRHEDARRQLELATVIATQLARVTGDRYLIDVATRVRTSHGAALKALREGHVALRDARRDERVRPAQAAAHYERARRLFVAAESPAAARAQLGHAIAFWFASGDPAQARAMLVPVERVARARNYWSLLTRVEANGANFLLYESRHVEALAHYDAAVASAKRMNDRENVANMHTRKVGVLRTLGQKDRASREALLALRSAPGVVDVPSRHHLLGENAAAALAHGYAGIAIVYQNEAVRLLETALSDPHLEEQQIEQLRNNLASALRARAAIQLHLERHQAAEEDLNNALRLTSESANRSDEIVRNALLARIQEVAGQTAIKAGDPKRAAEAFTEALAVLFPGEYRTFRAILFIQRADAYGASGDTERAERDLRIAIGELRAEEQQLLEGRRRGDAEAFLTLYFSRFRDVYEHLIHQLVDQNRTKEAFAIAEQARAFEPLTLVLQLGVVSDSLRRWTRDGKTLPLETIQTGLPDNTFLVEFSVLPDRTYVWIVGRRHFELVTRWVRRDDIDRWSNALRRYARERNDRAFVVTLEKAHDALLAEPLRKIEKLTSANEPPTLVFVPDRSIHGLPLAALRNRIDGGYVIERHPVSIAASATFYLFSLDRDAALVGAADRPSVLLVGEPAFDRRLELAQGLDRLPWAGSEVDRIEDLYAPAAIKIEGAGATVPEFLRLAQQSTIVHFAGHAIANPDAPFRSLLLLAPSANDSGVLVAEEILTRLRADKTRLIVLSACSSAGDVPIGPEGLAPLVRPLIAAGVPAVVGSLWKVDDHPSAELLVAFHRHFRAGHDADRALRLAQLELLRKKDTAYGSVLAWAPFQIIGHTSSPYGSKQERASQ